MKAKLGLAIGVNVAVACLLMQGCKAPGARGSASAGDVRTVEEAPAPVKVEDPGISVAPAPAEAPAPAPAPTVVPASPVEPAPAVVVAEPAPAESDFTLYTIRRGDMLSKISRRYNIRQRAILDMNPGLNPNKLYIGRTIKLPGKVEVAAPAAAPAAEAAAIKAPKTVKAAKYTGPTKVYVVKSGDSLGKIAYANGTNVRTLKELNALKGDRLLVGQKLKVPAVKAAAKKDSAAPTVKAAKKTESKEPVVKADVGKAPAKPAEAPKAEVKTEAAAPAAAPAAEPAAKSAPAAEPAANAAPAPAAAVAEPEVHTVKEGEDVVSIAISYGVTPSALMDLNDLKSSEVKPGDKLKIPVKNAQ